ncbi:hypothetical protein RF11_14915 [Thelohanellus kitauei]|uniref:Uncharacterized protein n=1 Tax=Thelohanellus kitauei TaxID=669202 RepID=A0A0C2NFM2_THEKT|nr:hypothetical protein RF11_14915 [Thelohanellus kitauei]
MLRSPITVFRFIPIEPHLETSHSDYARLKMTPDTHFPVNFRDMVEMILNIWPNARALLIENCLECFKDIIDKFNNGEHVADVAKVSLDSIYKWLALVPGPAFKIYIKTCYSLVGLDDFLSDIDVCLDLKNISIVWRSLVATFPNPQV